MCGLALVSSNICEVSRALPHNLHPTHRGLFEYSILRRKIERLPIQSPVAEYSHFQNWVVDVNAGLFK
jgi:hypothetical protein